MLFQKSEISKGNVHHANRSHCSHSINTENLFRQTDESLFLSFSLATENLHSPFVVFYKISTQWSARYERSEHVLTNLISFNWKNLIFIVFTMRYILHICSVSVMFTIIRGSFLFDDPGDALFLTQYIERGDIETVMLLRYSINLIFELLDWYFSLIFCDSIVSV